jgi:hypothetical protein
MEGLNHGNAVSLERPDKGRRKLKKNRMEMGDIDRVVEKKPLDGLDDVSGVESVGKSLERVPRGDRLFAVS